MPHLLIEDVKTKIIALFKSWIYGPHQSFGNMRRQHTLLKHIGHTQHKQVREQLCHDEMVVGKLIHQFICDFHVLNVYGGHHFIKIHRCNNILDKILHMINNAHRHIIIIRVAIHGAFAFLHHNVDIVGCNGSIFYGLSNTDQLLNHLTVLQITLQTINHNGRTIVMVFHLCFHHLVNGTFFE